MKRMRGRKGKGRGKGSKPVVTQMSDPMSGGRKKGRGRRR